MKFIDKTPNDALEQKTIDDFMAAHWVDDQGMYVNIDYSELRHQYKDGCGTSRDAKDELENYCKQEQQHYCCYCMRDISNDDYSLEHIIPQKFKGSNQSDEAKERKEFNDYIGYKLPFLNQQSIALAYDFDRTKKLQAPLFPHDIAPHNIVVSCEGIYSGIRGVGASNTCNHPRGSEHIYPLFFDRLIATQLEYTPSGRVKPPKDYSPSGQQIDLVKTIDSCLNLNHVTLVQCRRLWYLSRHETMAVLKNLSGDKVDNIREEFISNLPEYDQIKDFDILAKFQAENMWNLFLKYHWFHNYYAQKYL